MSERGFTVRALGEIAIRCIGLDQLSLSIATSSG